MRILNQVRTMMFNLHSKDQQDWKIASQRNHGSISIDGSVHIKVASISWQGWKIEACEQEIMTLKA